MTTMTGASGVHEPGHAGLFCARLSWRDTGGLSLFSAKPLFTGGSSVPVIKDVWILVALFVPLVFIAILSRRDEPTQRLVAVLHALAKLWRK
jgi:hypothetical protein